MSCVESLIDCHADFVSRPQARINMHGILMAVSSVQKLKGYQQRLQGVVSKNIPSLVQRKLENNQNRSKKIKTAEGLKIAHYIRYGGIYIGTFHLLRLLLVKSRKSIANSKHSATLSYFKHSIGMNVKRNKQNIESIF